MRTPPTRSLLFVGLCFVSLLILSACQSNDDNANTTATTLVTPPGVQTLTVVPQPQAIADMMKARDKEDQALPTLRVISPANNAVINGSTVHVKLELDGDLKGYLPHKDPSTGKGNHIHVILDNQPYEAYYELNQPFEMRNVSEGKHTLRVFPSRPWHESYKSDGAFQVVEFTVKNGGASKDASKPVTTNDGQTMSSPHTQSSANASPTPAREVKDFAPSIAGAFDPAPPLLTYSRPKGEYKGEDTDPIMIDFWLSNAKLQSDGGEYRVRYTVDGGEARFIDTWKPIWLSGWINGKHTIKVELVDKDGKLVDNGGYNSTTREINVIK